MVAKKRASTRRTAEKRRRYEGPVEWLFPMLEEAYHGLGPRDVVEPALVGATAARAAQQSGPGHRRSGERNSPRGEAR